MKKILIFAICMILIVGAVVFILDIKVTTRQGINYEVHTLKIPLYLKILNFYDRHYNYKWLVHQITEGKISEEDRAVAIFKWTVENIAHRSAELRAVDDHVWHIIVRGYATIDQSADVFTTLCTYDGFRAVMYKAYSPDKKSHVIISLVGAKDRYLVFDTFFDRYFFNERGEIASLTNIIENPNLVDRDKYDFLAGDTPYYKHFLNLRPMGKLRICKAELNMPVKRFVYEVLTRLNIMEKAVLFY